MRNTRYVKDCEDRCFFFAEVLQESRELKSHGHKAGAALLFTGSQKNE